MGTRLSVDGPRADDSFIKSSYSCTAREQRMRETVHAQPVDVSQIPVFHVPSRITAAIAGFVPVR
jgi:hypothetical protein